MTGVANLFFKDRWIHSDLIKLRSLRERVQYDADYYAKTEEAFIQTIKNFCVACRIGNLILELCYRRFIAVNRKSTANYPLNEKIFQSEEFKAFFELDETKELLSEVLVFEETNDIRNQFLEIAKRLAETLFDPEILKNIESLLNCSKEDLINQIITPYFNELRNNANLIQFKITESQEDIYLRINNIKEELDFLEKWQNGEIQDLQILQAEQLLYKFDTMQNFLDWFNHYKAAYHNYINLIDLTNITKRLDEKDQIIGKYTDQVLKNIDTILEKTNLSNFEKQMEIAAYLEKKLGSYYEIEMIKNIPIKDDDLIFNEEKNIYLIDLYAVPLA